MAKQIIIGPNPSDRDEWLSARGKLITSTDIARIMRGEGYTCYHEKIGTIESFAGNRATRRGNRFQRPTLEEYAEEAGAHVLDGLPLLIDPDCQSLAATPDAVAMPSGEDYPSVATIPDGPMLLSLLSDERGYGVEAKTSLSPKVAVDLAEGEDGSDYTPEAWQWQCQSQMAVTGWQWVDVAILLFGKLKIRRILRNATLIDVCRATATEYADRVARKLEPPMVPTSEANQATIKHLYGPAAGVTIDLSQEAAELWAKKAAASATATAAKKEADAVDAELRQLFGNAEIGKMPDGSTLRLGKVTVPPQMREGYEFTRFWFKKGK